MNDRIKIVVNPYKTNISDIGTVKIIRDGSQLSGKLENLFLNQSNGTLKITGSITKYFKGENYLDNLNFDELVEAYELLSNELEFNLNDATTKSCEFGLNFDINEQPFHVINSIVSHSKFKTKGNYNGSKYFHINNDIQFICYDKSQEKRDKRKNPSKNNIIRFELKFHRNLKNRIKTKSLKLNEMLNLQTWNWFITELTNSIQELNFEVIDYDIDFENLTPRDIQQIICKISPIPTNNLINSISKFQFKDRRKKYNLKKSLKDIQKDTKGVNFRDFKKLILDTIDCEKEKLYVKQS